MTPTNVDTGLAAVDVSSICRDDVLPLPEGAHRLELVLGAWRAQMSTHTDFFLVADRSLLKRLSRKQAVALRRMRSAGDLRVVGAGRADGEILDWADRNGGCVLSRDRFLTERDGRRWVPERFYAWEVEDGQLRIVRRRIRNTRPFDISRKREQKLVAEHGFEDLDHPALRRRWVCVSDVACFNREMQPDGLRVPPLLVDGAPCCPGCRQALRDVGERSALVELKLVIDDVTHMRFTVAPGRTVAFGRLTMPDTEALAALAADGAFAGLGRAHVELRLRGRSLSVRPVDERHRVRHLAWSRPHRAFTPDRDLSHVDGFTTLGLRDSLLLGDHVVLTRSGRSISEEEELLEADGRAPWQRQRTVGSSKG